MKALYIRLVRMLRSLFRAIGLLGFLERRMHRSRTSLWFRSLFAVYDFDDLVWLDLPWWTLSAVDAVDAFLAARPDARAFEYGSGASTVWLSKRCAHVVSVEHDAGWAELVEAKAAGVDNIEIMAIVPEVAAVGDEAFRSGRAGYEDKSFRAYVQAIEAAGGPFDLILVDGRARNACLWAAERHLAPGGIIIFDNAGRKRYRPAIEGSSLPRREYRGLAACLPYVDNTCILGPVLP